MSEKTIFFGIDPGTAATGFGVIGVINNTVMWEDAGVISPAQKGNLAEKLETIYDALLERLAVHRPAYVCIEQAFYAKNARTTLILGHARGAAILAARKSGARVEEYSPREIKKALVGNGGASKEQVAYMVNAVLSPPGGPRQSDATDALAAALCSYYNCNNYARMLGKGVMR